MSPQVAKPNPQIAAATENGAINVIPSFITANGPVREALGELMLRDAICRNRISQHSWQRTM